MVNADDQDHRSASGFGVPYVYFRHGDGSVLRRRPPRDESGGIGPAAELALHIETMGRIPGQGVIFSGGPGSRLVVRAAVDPLANHRLVVWTANANEATAGAPLGALAELMPRGQPVGVSQTALMRWAFDALCQRAAGRRMVFVVNDAHLLDPLSATQLYHLARTESAVILGTIGADESAPDPIRALWIEGLVRHIRVAAPPF